jgi:hypothetical protein
MAELKDVCKADLILFTVQVVIIFVVVCTSLINLTLGYGNQNLWTVVLTSSLGYVMPNPKIKIDEVLKEQKTIKGIEVNG